MQIIYVQMLFCVFQVNDLEICVGKGVWPVYIVKTDSSSHLKDKSLHKKAGVYRFAIGWSYIVSFIAIIQVGKFFGVPFYLIYLIKKMSMEYTPSSWLLHGRTWLTDRRHVRNNVTKATKAQLLMENNRGCHNFF